MRRSATDLDHPLVNLSVVERLAHAVAAAGGNQVEFEVDIDREPDTYLTLHPRQAVVAVELNPLNKDSIAQTRASHGPTPGSSRSLLGAPHSVNPGLDSVHQGISDLFRC